MYACMYVCMHVCMYIWHLLVNLCIYDSPFHHATVQSLWPWG